MADEVVTRSPRVLPPRFWATFNGELIMGNSHLVGALEPQPPDIMDTIVPKHQQNGELISMGYLVPFGTIEVTMDINLKSWSEELDD